MPIRTRPLASLLSFALLSVVSPGAGAAPRDAAVPRAIVRISALHTHPDLQAPWQRMRPHAMSGSGVIVAGRRVLTNAHVVEDASMLEVQTESSSRTYTASLLFVSHELDLALLGVEDEAFFAGTTPLAVGDVPELRSRVNVFGFPEGGSAVSVTSGVVSRIELERYVHSAEYFLRAQIDAAINPGNSGGPVVSAEGEIVGIAMMVRQASENIGYMVPAPVVRHFLRDVEDGALDGVPDLGVLFQPLENSSMRKALGVPDEIGGALVIALDRGGAAQGTLQLGDVLVAYDGLPIDRDGQVRLANGLRVNATYVEESKQVGEPLEVTYLRAGEKRHAKIVSRRTPRFLRTRADDGAPRYFVYGGLVFQALSAQYVRSFQRPLAFPYLYLEEFTLGPNATLVEPAAHDARREVVILSNVLSDDLNRGYGWVANSTIWSVDDQPVTSFDDLVEKLEHGTAPYVRIVTESGALIVLERAAVQSRNAKILARYGLASDRSGGLPASPAR